MISDFRYLEIKEISFKKISQPYHRILPGINEFCKGVKTNDTIIQYAIWNLSHALWECWNATKHWIFDKYCYKFWYLKIHLWIFCRSEIIPYRLWRWYCLQKITESPDSDPELGSRKQCMMIGYHKIFMINTFEEIHIALNLY